jgi:hypothetical protein
MANATQTALGGTKLFLCSYLSRSPYIYDQRHPDCARRHKTVSVQLTEQEPGIYAKRHRGALGGTKLFLFS